jgi:hypothetical protein
VDIDADIVRDAAGQSHCREAIANAEMLLEDILAAHGIAYNYSSAALQQQLSDAQRIRELEDEVDSLRTLLRAKPAETSSPSSAIKVPVPAATATATPTATWQVASPPLSSKGGAGQRGPSPPPPLLASAAAAAAALSPSLKPRMGSLSTSMPPLAVNPPPRKLSVDGDKEVKAVEIWLSLHDVPITNFWEQIRDGLPIVHALEFITPGCVDWKQLHKGTAALTSTNRLTNCAYALKLLRQSFGIYLPEVQASDIAEARRKPVIDLMQALIKK